MTKKLFACLTTMLFLLVTGCETPKYTPWWANETGIQN